MTLLKTDWRPVTAFLDSAVAAGAAPGAVLGVSVAGIRFIHAAGQMGPDEPARPEPTTVYDLASLTKAVGLATAAMLAVASKAGRRGSFRRRVTPNTIDPLTARMTTVPIST